MSEEQTKILMTYAVVAVVWYVVQTVGCMFLFKKTGTSKGMAFIPLLREKALFDPLGNLIIGKGVSEYKGKM